MLIPTFAKPTSTKIAAFLSRQHSDLLSYEARGCTHDQAPRGWFVDRYRVCLGRGQAVFATACAALDRWEMFRTGWTEVFPAGDSVAVDQPVAVLIRAFGLWWLNAAKIVYVCEATSTSREYGFAYGTLADHAERGEERFWVRWDADDQVWYELTAMSRPTRWWLWASLPLLRRLQRQFAAASQYAMQRACAAK